MITYETHEISSHVLSPEGAQIALEGSHEARVWAALPLKGEGRPITPAELKKIVGDESAKVGQGRAFKSGWVGKDGDGLVKIVSLTRSATLELPFTSWKTQVSSIKDTTQLDLREVDSTGALQSGEKILADLRKRKLITQR